MKKAYKYRGLAGLRRSLAIAAAAALTLGAAAGSKAALVFDNYTAAAATNSLTSTSSTPNTFMGDGYIMRPGTIDITGFDIFPVNNTGTNFTGLRITIYVWGTVNTGTVSAATPAFSNLLNTYTVTSAGTYTSGFFYSFVNATSPGVNPGIALTTPQLLTTGTTLGITLAYQGTTDGVTYSSVNNLSSLIAFGAAPTVGSQVFNGYYRNANSEVDGNFTSAVRSLGSANQSLALRVYGDVLPVPEPGTWAMIALGGVALLVCRQRLARTA